MHGLLDDNQKTECRTMLTAIAAAVRSNRSPVILEDERLTLRRCWERGAKTVAELNIIRAVYGRMRNVKTSEQATQGIADWVNEGRQKNGHQ